MTTDSPPLRFGGRVKESPQHSPQRAPEKSPLQSLQGMIQQSLERAPRQSQPEKLKRSTDRRVSFAVGENLCQIRLFVAEDAPFMSGSVQEQLQAKPTRNLHIFNSTSCWQASEAPPGFGGMAVKLNSDVIALAAVVPQLSWRPPSLLNLDPTWHVVAGGASLEIVSQLQREVRVLEAVYPRPSSIPESPAEPLEAQKPYDDSSTPQIPLVPLEEEDVLEGHDISAGPSGPNVFQGLLEQVTGVQTIPPIVPGLPNRFENAKYVGGTHLVSMQENSHARKESSWRDPSTVPSGKSADVLIGRPTLSSPHYLHSKKTHNSEPNIEAAAVAALAAVSKLHEVGNMIDNELLIQILSDPSLVQSLMTKSQFPLANLKLDLPSNGSKGGIEKMNKLEVINGMMNNGNPWTNISSAMFVPPPVIHSEGPKMKNCGNEKLPRCVLPDEMYSTTFSVSMITSHPDSEPKNGTVEPKVSRPISSDAPPGFGKFTSGSKLPGFGNKSAPSQGTQSMAPHVAIAPMRPLSWHDVQYCKNLIMQHGCKSANDDDHERAGFDAKVNGDALPSGAYDTSEVEKMWLGKDDLDGSKGEKLMWLGRDELDGHKGKKSGPETTNGIVSTLGHAPRTKSRKLCIYYGTSRGCRNGDNCTFVHESPNYSKDEKMRMGGTHSQYSKRLKVDG